MKLQRNSQSTHIKIWAAAAAIALLLTGCQSSVESRDSYWFTTSEAKNGSPQKSYEVNTQNADSEDAPSQNRPDSNEHEASTEASKPGSNQEHGISGKTPVPSEDWSMISPQLLGISIGDSDSLIESQFGKELDRYSLIEEAGDIQVLEYDGFAVGLNTGGVVHFVEVHSSHIAAGLSGLRIGDKPEKAINELGKPDTQSDYLLVYDAEGAMLKLDVDPDANKIVSMKLLSQG